MSKLVSLSDLADEINAAWQKTREGILETARLCADANRQLGDSKAKQQFIDRLHFEHSTFSKLVKIGEQPQLRADPVRSLLPANYTIVYELAGLNEEELNAAVEDHVIKPKMTRKALKLWIDRRRGTHKAARNLRVIATLQAPEDFDERQQAQLERSLEALQTKYGLIVERPRDPQEAQLRSADKKVVQRIRQRAQEFTDRLISDARHRAQRSGDELSEAELKQWRYSKEEQDIPKDASWDQIRTYLDRIGHGYQFERLVGEALVLNGVAEEEVREHPPIDHEEALVLMKGAVANALPEPKTLQN
jgi:hypothetical protein